MSDQSSAMEDRCEEAGDWELGALAFSSFPRSLIATFSSRLKSTFKKLSESE